MVLEKRSRQPSDAKLALERFLFRPDGAKFALHRRFEWPDGAKLALDRYFAIKGLARTAHSEGMVGPAFEAPTENLWIDSLPFAHPGTALWRLHPNRAWLWDVD